ncbi:MAG: aldo/keto reductase [Actinomycetota bacterium]|nr:aldo/keto reductase [Actinomycetota bacterium]
MRTIGSTQVAVFPLCLGSNIFGWTVDEPSAFAVLDAYAAAGGNFIDSADSYSAWVGGNSGGESETMIGRWMASRGNRDDLVIATKVGKMPGLAGLAPATIRRAAEGSLTRLGTDRIDLYYAHLDDEDTPLEDTLAAFGQLIDEGKVRHIAASNYGAPRLAEALAVARANGLPSYVAVQPHYNLVHRGDYEGELADLCAREGLSCVPYFALASGFLTGKYRIGGADTGSPRVGGARAYLDDRGVAVLAALDEVAASHGTTVAAVALAWLAAQTAVAAPIASARTPEQLADLLPFAGLVLDDGELQRLSSAAAPVVV